MDFLILLLYLKFIMLIIISTLLVKIDTMLCSAAAALGSCLAFLLLCGCRITLESGILGNQVQVGAVYSCEYIFVLLTFNRTTHAVLLACSCSHADEDDKDENEEQENLHDCCLIALLIG